MSMRIVHSKDDPTTSDWWANGYPFTGPFPSIQVFYDDGSNEVYDADGLDDSIVLIEGPGTLQFVRLEDSGVDYHYYYTYTENGITTPEVCLRYWFYD